MTGIEGRQKIESELQVEEMYWEDVIGVDGQPR
jgi:hypothetical protein